jgi:DNA-binding winged helix-turn-helix (wHTH) protein/alpha-beta hydrolase superfamily lysophospholipase
VRYSFDGVEIDTDRFVLHRDGVDVPVEPQVFDVLAYLVEHRDRLVTKNELLDEIWGDRFVSESALTSRIKSARRLVGDDGTRQGVIQTVHGRGYRFVAPVEVHAEPSRPERPAVSERKIEQRIHFTTAPDGVRLAYATVGSGPPLVRAAHWITHLDYDWHSPVWRHWIEGLARRHTLIRYDERGCGLSDHDPAEISLEAFVRDLETVVDAAGLDRFPLLGVSQGGAVAISYAARHPERVSKLVLLGAYLRGRRARAADEQAVRAAQLQIELVRHGWGSDDPSFRMALPPSFMPDAPPELWSDFAELMRRTASTENALRILLALQEVDVSRDAARLEVPTIVFHASAELRIPFEQARELATTIRGSRLVPLDSRNHLMLPDEPAWSHFLNEMEEFVDET